MPNIKPVSDLRSYSIVLDEVSQGSPVFLTKNGHGRYAILDIADYERYEAEQTLLSELERGRRVAQEQDVFDGAQVRTLFKEHFGFDVE